MVSILALAVIRIWLLRGTVPGQMVQKLSGVVANLFSQVIWQFCWKTLVFGNVVHYFFEVFSLWWIGCDILRPTSVCQSDSFHVLVPWDVFTGPDLTWKSATVRCICVDMIVVFCCTGSARCSTSCHNRPWHVEDGYNKPQMAQIQKHTDLLTWEMSW